MSYTAALVLLGDGQPGDDVPRRLDRASVALNHGLLVGEILGIPVAAAGRVLDEVAEREAPVFTAAEARLLREVYGQVRATLGRAVGSDGVPLPGPAGDSLRGSDLLEADAGGALAVRHRRMPLTQLRHQLDLIDRMLGVGASGDSLLALEPT